MITKLTVEQAIILTGFTGKLCCAWGDFHGDVEKRLGHPVYTHQFAHKEVWEEVKEAYREDFMKLLPEGCLERNGETTN